MSDDLCSGFDPQTYLTDRCKRCFRVREKHGTAISVKDKSRVSSFFFFNFQKNLCNPDADSAAPVRRHMSWRERVYGQNAQNGDETTKTAAASTDNDDTKSNKSFRSITNDSDVDGSDVVTSKSGHY